MDLLDPLENSGESEEHERKVIINQGLSITDDSDDEQRVIDHLSPQTLLETPTDSDMHYSFRSPEGTITYRVLQVDDATEPQIMTAASNFNNGNVPQVITSNLNGQLYLIGSTNEVFNNQTGSARAIAPRASLIEAGSPVTTNLKKRDERRRATHNEVERRRRDKINNWITKLSKIIPESSCCESKGNGHFDGQSKGGILAKACDYILELKEDRERLEVALQEYKQLSQNLEIVTQEKIALEEQNKALLGLLKRNGIEVNSEIDL